MARTTKDRVVTLTVGIPSTQLAEIDKVVAVINSRREKPVSRSAYCSYLLSACFASKILCSIMQRLSKFSTSTINELDSLFTPDLFGDVDKIIDSVDAGLVEQLKSKRSEKKV